MFVLGDLEKEIVKLEEVMQSTQQLRIRVNPVVKKDQYFVNLVAALACTSEFPYYISDGEEVMENGNHFLDYIVGRKKPLDNSAGV